MFCKNCGSKLKEDTKFCSICGVLVGNGDAFCDDCGKNLHIGDPYCPHCGKAFFDTEETILYKDAKKHKEPAYKSFNIKKVIALVLALVVVLCGAGFGIYKLVEVNIDDDVYSSQALNYQLSTDQTYYTVTGIGTCTDTELVIPSTYNDKPVKAIGDSAFHFCDSLTSITIGSGVTSIGDFAFRDCSSLTSITVPDSVKILGDYAFYNCSSLTSVTIRSGVTSIGEEVFRYCRSLTSIKYCGTEEEWKAINKGSNWDYDMGDYTITYNYSEE